jgi:hypothetical protein
MRWFWLTVVLSAAAMFSCVPCEDVEPHVSINRTNMDIYMVECLSNRHSFAACYWGYMEGAEWGSVKLELPKDWC